MKIEISSVNKTNKRRYKVKKCEKAAPQYVRFEQSLGEDSQPMHCPICGKSTSKKYCDHLAFIFGVEDEDFCYKSKGFEKKSGCVKSKRLTYGTLRKFLQRVGYKNNLLVIEITYSGMACGPVEFTAVYGFDYGSLDEEEC